MNDDIYTRETKKAWDAKSFQRYTDLDRDRSESIVEYAYSHPDLLRSQNREDNLYEPTEILVGIAERLHTEDIDTDLSQLKYALRGHQSKLDPGQQIP